MPSKNPDRSMHHLNGNLLCSIDCETTGLLAGIHDIWQIAVVPLGPDIRPIRTIQPFYLNIKPSRPENIDPKAIDISRLAFATAMQSALDSYVAADLFDEWFERLKLPIWKKIIPLGHNWLFDRGFILDWLGPETFDQLIGFPHRDTMVALAFFNDALDFQNEPIRFPKYSLKAMCSWMKITNEKPHDALHDAIATAEVYRRLLSLHTFHNDLLLPPTDPTPDKVS